MRRPRTVMRFVLGGTVLAAILLGAPSPGARAADGGALFRAYCADCHGPSGRGDGASARYFDPAPRDLRTGFLARYDDATLIRRLREGVSLPLVLDPEGLRTRGRQVEVLADYIRTLPAVDWRRVEPGEEIWVDRCELCHGPTGRPPAASELPPGVRAPRDLSDPAFQRSISDRELAVVVRHGKDGMPAMVPQLSAADAEALVAFVRLLSPGFDQYRRWCANCHGLDGRGAEAHRSTFPRPLLPFDEAYFRHRDREQVRAAIWTMLDQYRPTMPHFEDTLSEPDAAAIVQYLKTTTTRDGGPVAVK